MSVPVRWHGLLVAMFGVMIATAGIDQLVSSVPILALPVGVGLVIAAVAGYRWLCRTVELRPGIPELEQAGRWSQLGRGALLGFGLFTGLMSLIAVSILLPRHAARTGQIRPRAHRTEPST